VAFGSLQAFRRGLERIQGNCMSNLVLGFSFAGRSLSHNRNLVFPAPCREQQVAILFDGTVGELVKPLSAKRLAKVQ
jgi:hypothetical protein